MKAKQEVYCFFFLFCTVYFLEAIGGFYMTSAVQSIERQFQIPSRVSGLMVAAGDFGYIPSVVFVSYLGSKGNRARWIGGGCLLIAVANFLISSPNFLFPVKTPMLNSSLIEYRLSGDPSRLKSSLLAIDFLNKVDPNGSYNERFRMYIDNQAMSLSEFSKHYLRHCEHALMHDNSTDHNLCQAFYAYMAEQNRPSLDAISELRAIVASPMSVCDEMVNGLRSVVSDMNCVDHQPNTGPLLVIFLGLIILGIGRTMPFSLGIPLVDDNVKSKNMPLYFAGMFFVRILGPTLGLMIGGQINRIYYTLKAPMGLSPRDPTWIGAWWLGFLGISIVLFGPSLALFCFPSFMKSDAEREFEAKGHELERLHSETKGHSRKPSRSRLALVDRHAQKDSQGRALVPATLLGKAKDFFTSLWDCLKTPLYFGALIGRIIDVLAFRGFFLYLPKYAENQFGMPQHKVQYALAGFGFSGFALGVIGGSLVMRLFKLQGRRAAFWVAMCSLVAASFSFIQANVGCKSVVSTIGDIGVQNNFNFNNTCNEHCSCDHVPIYPVCNMAGEPFFSPCHAGCPLPIENITTLGKNGVFSDCICAGNETTVSRDFCRQEHCDNMFLLYFINMGVSGIVAGMGVVPGMLIILRAVPPRHRSISLGFNGFLVSLFATLPSPILWGAIVDTACIRWDKTCTGEGSCLIYDSVALRLRTHIVYGGMRLVALIFDVWMFYWAKGLILTDEEEETVKGTEEKIVIDPLNGVVEKEQD